MTNKQQPAPLGDDSKDQNEQVGLLDLGDAAIETKQTSPAFLYPDCLYGFGTKYGC